MSPLPRGSLALVLTLFAAACGNEEPASRPNVLLVVVDTLRADRLGCYGYEQPTTPNIDRLASEGLLFARAVSQAPWTTPSIGSLLTSRYPSELGITTERSPLPAECPLLSETLQQAGYVTGGVVSHRFCSSAWEFGRGFSWFDESNIQGHDAVTSEGVTRKALEFVDSVGDRPFFLWAHYFDPHFLYVDHEAFDPDGSDGYDGPIESGMSWEELLALEQKLTEEDLQELHRLYDSEIAWTDHWIGELFDGLRQRGLWDDTLVVFTADHGEEFEEHGRLGHALTLYPEVLRVPLILKRPGGVDAGEVIGDVVPLIDVSPTVLALAGLPPVAGSRGLSLFRPQSRTLPIVSETARAGGVQSVVHDGFKLIRHLQSGRVELYDVEEDPTQHRDLAAGLPDVTDALGAELDRWQGSLEVHSADRVEVNQLLLQELRQLGYAGADERGSL